MPALVKADRRRASRTQAERSGATRARILDAAVECIAQEGFARTNLARIAGRAGISVGAIQHQFGDKEAVLEAVVEWALDELVNEVARLPVASSGVDERVELLVHTLWRRYALASSRAAVEILVQMRAEHDFFARTLSNLAKIRGAIDRMWMGLFWEVGASRERHIRAQRLLLTTLTGLAVEATLMPEISDTEQDLATLSQGILRILTEHAEAPLLSENA